MTVSQFTANCRGVAISAKSQSALVTRSLKDGVPVLPPTKNNSNRISNPEALAPVDRIELPPMESESIVLPLYETGMAGET